MTHKPSLLFLAPVMPAPTGNGLAMRAGLILDALARNFSVHLLVVPLFGAERISRFAKERAARAMVAHLDPRDDALRLAASDPKRAMALRWRSRSPSFVGSRPWHRWGVWPRTSPASGSMSST